MRKARLTLALILLVLSLAVLAWGLWPSVRELRILRVQPSEITLPTPSSFVLPALQVI